MNWCFCHINFQSKSWRHVDLTKENAEIESALAETSEFIDTYFTTIFKNSCLHIRISSFINFRECK